MFITINIVSWKPVGKLSRYNPSAEAIGSGDTSDKKTWETISAALINAGTGKGSMRRERQLTITDH